MIDQETQGEIAPQPYKRYCLHEHDTWAVGRFGNGQCKTCKRELNARNRADGRYRTPRLKICVRGHDRFEEGVTTSGQCRACWREDRRRRYREEAAGKVNARFNGIYLTRLKTVRKELGVTAKDVARHSGYSVSHIRAIEGGHRKATRWAQERILWAVVRLREEKAERLERIAKAGLS